MQPSPCAFSLIDTTGLTSYSSTVRRAATRRRRPQSVEREQRARRHVCVRSSLRFVDTTGEQLVAVTLKQNNVSSYYSVRGWQSLTAAAAALQAGAATVAPTVTLTGATTVAPVPHEPVSAGVAMSADARVVAVLNGNVVNVRVVSGSATGVAALAATAASQQLTLNASVPHLTLDVAPAGDLVAVSEGPGVGLYHSVRTPTLGRSTGAVPRRRGLRTPQPELRTGVPRHRHLACGFRAALCRAPAATCRRWRSAQVARCWPRFRRRAR